jgi:hypothetical protein
MDRAWKGQRGQQPATRLGEIDMTDTDARRKADEERKALDAYLGKNIRLEQPPPA